VTAKDLILHIIGQIGIGGGTGHVLEYTGEAIRALSMEERMTVCNMSIEAGARAGLIAPDETTFAWLKGRERAPQGDAWDRAVARWRTLPTDGGARYDREVRIDASAIHTVLHFGLARRRCSNDEPAGSEKVRKQLAALRTLILIHPGDAGGIHVQVGRVAENQELDQRRKDQHAAHTRIAKRLQEFLADHGAETLSH